MSLSRKIILFFISLAITKFLFGRPATQEINKITEISASSKSINNTSHQAPISADHRKIHNPPLVSSKPNTGQINSIPSQENCTTAEISKKKLKTSPEVNNNLKLCLRYLNIVQFDYNGKTAKDCVDHDNINRLPTNDCLKLVSAYRKMTDVFNGDSNLWNQLDNETLMTALNAFQRNLANNNIEKFQEFIQYMIERNPENSIVAKASLFPFKAQSPAEMIEHIRQNLDYASRLNPNDPEILGVKMLLAVTKGDKGVLEKLETFNAKNPDSGIGYIYAAAIHHKMGNHDLSQEAISQALEDKSPYVQRLAGMAQLAIDGKVNEVGIMIANGVVVTIPVNSIDQLIR